ncbi:MAG: hypothetical protein ACOYLB_08385 [Phototrophicaceae bacterium]
MKRLMNNRSLHLAILCLGILFALRVSVPLGLVGSAFGQVSTLRTSINGSAVGDVNLSAVSALSSQAISLNEGNSATLLLQVLNSGTAALTFSEASANPTAPQCQLRTENSLTSGSAVTNANLDFTATASTTVYLFALNDSVSESGTHNCTYQLTVGGTNYLQIIVTINPIATTTPTTPTATPIPFSGTATVAPTALPTATPTPDVVATRVSSLRTALGNARGTVSDEVQGLSIRRAPMVGASLLSVARPNIEYTVVGLNRNVASSYVWYLIEYGTEESSRQGWVSGRYFEPTGYFGDIPYLANPLDSVGNLPNTGVTGQSGINNTVLAYPAPNSGVVDLMRAGQTYQILGRTVIDRRLWTDWLLIRVDASGRVGWLKFTDPAYTSIVGDISAVPEL